jgi:hypothetical protein
MAPDLLSTICREIDQRLSELRPRMAEYERLLVAADALFTTGHNGSAAIETAVTAKRGRRATRLGTAAKPKAERAARGAARESILAALEHGSHTVGELVVVTAMSGPNVNGNLRRLVAEGIVAKTEREGKTAWSLANAAI